MREILTKEPIEIINQNNNSLPFIISIPHSGTLLTKEMLNNLEDKVILANSDWYLDKLYSFLKKLGYTVIINKMNRYVIDPNRELKEVSDDSFWHNAIYPMTTYGHKLYKKDLSSEEKSRRINIYYKNYHDNLQKLIEEKLKYFDKVYLIDLHSFGSPIPYDIVLGNNDFKTASLSFSELLKKIFEKYNFTVEFNAKFKGGYIVKHYGDIKKCEAIQIELSYLKYIEKRDFKEEEFPDINEILFLKTKAKLEKIFKELKDKIEI